jgi:hypothetical protein
MADIVTPTDYMASDATLIAAAACDTELNTSFTIQTGDDPEFCRKANPNNSNQYRLNSPQAFF